MKCSDGAPKDRSHIKFRNVDTMDKVQPSSNSSCDDMKCSYGWCVLSKTEGIECDYNNPTLTLRHDAPVG